MAKCKERERPGVIFRFDWLPTLEKMGEEAKARFLMAALYRGRNPTREIDLKGLLERDAIRLETLWEQAAPKIDEDGDGWKNGVIQRKYATYCREMKKAGEVPIPWEDYLTWYQTMNEEHPDILID